MQSRIDLHVHSKYSGDNDSEPEESVVRAIELKLSGLVFTEHYYFEASEFAEGLNEKYGDSIMIFRGVEFSAREGHCLVFGVNTDKFIPRHAPLSEVVRLTEKEGGVVVPSHPYRTGNSLGDAIRNARGIAAVEGFNGANMHIWNAKAIQAAEAMGIPFTGGSDAHAPKEVGSCFTLFRNVVTKENFLDQLRTGQFTGVDTRKITGRPF